MEHTCTVAKGLFQIEKLENMETLVNLQFLDVSYNRITKIEGLSELKKLKELHLVHNKITVIEGLEEVGTLRISLTSNIFLGHRTRIS